MSVGWVCTSECLRRHVLGEMLSSSCLKFRNGCCTRTVGWPYCTVHTIPPPYILYSEVLQSKEATTIHDDSRIGHLLFDSVIPFASKLQGNKPRQTFLKNTHVAFKRLVNALDRRGCVVQGQYTLFNGRRRVAQYLNKKHAVSLHYRMSNLPGGTVHTQQIQKGQWSRLIAPTTKSYRIEGCTKFFSFQG